MSLGTVYSEKMGGGRWDEGGMVGQRKVNKAEKYKPKSKQHRPKM